MSISVSASTAVPPTSSLASSSCVSTTSKAPASKTNIATTNESAAPSSSSSFQPLQTASTEPSGASITAPNHKPQTQKDEDRATDTSAKQTSASALESCGVDALRPLAPASAPTPLKDTRGEDKDEDENSKNAKISLSSSRQSPPRKRKVPEAGLGGLQLQHQQPLREQHEHNSIIASANRNDNRNIRGMSYAAAGCTGSSKAPTVKNGGLNEDRFQIAHLSLDRSDDNALYVGVFDGHGGPGASSYLFEHFLDSFRVVLSDDSASDAPLEDVLHHSFMEADRSLFADVERLGQEYAHLRDERCKCNFYRESPCRCMRAPRSAHEGSTATVLLYTNDRLYCANVGDSEALLVTKSGYIRSTNESGCREFDSPDTRSAVSHRFYQQRHQPRDHNHQQQQDHQRSYESQFALGPSSTDTIMTDQTALRPEASAMGMPGAAPAPPQGPHHLVNKPAPSTPIIDETSPRNGDASGAGVLSPSPFAATALPTGNAVPPSAALAASSPSNITATSTSPPVPAISASAAASSVPASSAIVGDGGGSGEFGATPPAQLADAPAMQQQQVSGSDALTAAVSMDTSDPAPRLVLRQVEPGCPETPSLRAETLTIADTPVPHLLNEDYIRVKQIAETRVRRKASKTRSSRSDGIRRGPSNRHNYVALEGAHSLNMTRAFGNYGHKVFSQDSPREIIEPESPIIVRPHVNIFEPAYKDDFLFVVVASDGLWDNLHKDEVSTVVTEFCARRLRASSTDSEPTSITSSPTRVAPSSTGMQDETKSVDSDSALLTSLAEGAAEELLSQALARNRKLDDITVVVVLFNSVLTAFRDAAPL
ncbi:Protein phosphatase 2C 1 [Hondaea fermentalgiana]|uniref:Protein phosphatase 2C 1 n=1 Tax=Hondaea fermentalgiana TaxID=2315210 RepID=A0A2R5GF06_9STRA|nr:Protein phosphatase 2C 1 [Hondaea fermentalgiana]|eukprot:GBG28899.1 Protein phosphatase 2C 1 [Hondaea fermentalgiana]